MPSGGIKGKYLEEDNCVLALLKKVEKGNNLGHGRT